MGFDLTGYESDNMDMKPLALYSIIGILALIVVIVAIYFYMLFMGEKYTQELFLGYLQGTWLLYSQLQIYLHRYRLQLLHTFFVY